MLSVIFLQFVVLTAPSGSFCKVAIQRELLPTH
jgi:hypothetical protein